MRLGRRPTGVPCSTCDGNPRALKSPRDASPPRAASHTALTHALVYRGIADRSGGTPASGGRHVGAVLRYAITALLREGLVRRCEHKQEVGPAWLQYSQQQPA